MVKINSLEQLPQDKLYSQFFAENSLVRECIEKGKLFQTYWQGAYSKNSCSFIDMKNVSECQVCANLKGIFGITNELFEGKYRMAISGDGQEYRRISTLHSSSLVALLCFYSLSKDHPLTMEIDGRKVEFYKGSYSFYVEERQRRFEERLKQYEKDQAKIAQLTEAAEKLHLWAFMGADKLHKRAFSIEKRIDKLSTSEKPKEAKKLSARFKEKAFLGDDVVYADNLSKEYSGKVLFSGLELLIENGERVAVMGDNGTGKTTLLSIINSDLLPDTGYVKTGPSIKKAYLPQIVSFIEPDLSVLETMMYECRIEMPEARSRLAAFGFRGDAINASVSSLSGGERSRLKLCMLMGKEINFLLLDEPTNHLDIISREWIEDALSDYSGTMLFVSHDRYFTEKFATRIILLENGRIIDHRGTYSEFAEWYDRQKSFENIKRAEAKASTPNSFRSERPKNSRKALERTEKQIEALEKKLSDIETEELEYSSDYVKLLESENRKNALKDEIAELYAKLEELDAEGC